MFQMSLQIFFTDDDEAKLTRIIEKAGYKPESEEAVHDFVCYKLGILDTWPVQLRSNIKCSDPEYIESVKFNYSRIINSSERTGQFTTSPR